MLIHYHISSQISITTKIIHLYMCKQGNNCCHLCSRSLVSCNDRMKKFLGQRGVLIINAVVNLCLINLENLIQCFRLFRFSVNLSTALAQSIYNCLKKSVITSVSQGKMNTRHRLCGQSGFSSGVCLPQWRVSFCLCLSLVLAGNTVCLGAVEGRGLVCLCGGVSPVQKMLSA